MRPSARSLQNGVAADFSAAALSPRHGDGGVGGLASRVAAVRCGSRQGLLRCLAHRHLRPFLEDRIAEQHDVAANGQLRLGFGRVWRDANALGLQHGNQHLREGRAVVELDE
jgi:hypothetical protein